MTQHRVSPSHTGRELTTHECSEQVKGHFTFQPIIEILMMKTFNLWNMSLFSSFISLPTKNWRFKHDYQVKHKTWSLVVRLGGVSGWNAVFCSFIFRINFIILSFCPLSVYDRDSRRLLTDFYFNLKPPPFLHLSWEFKPYFTVRTAG